MRWRKFGMDTASSPLGAGMNTTLGVIATNAKLNKDQATKIAQMAQDGFARAINPSHTPVDGDTIFAIGTGTTTAHAETWAIGALAADVMAMAVVRAIMQAESIPGYPSYRDMRIIIVDPSKRRPVFAGAKRIPLSWKSAAFFPLDKFKQVF